MKKTYFTALLLTASLILTACSKALPADAPSIKDTNSQAAENISGFDYGADGSLYTISLRESGEYEIYPPLNPGDEEIKKPIYEAVVKVTDSSGEEKQSFTFKQDTMNNTLEYKDGAVYFTALEYMDDEETTVLRKYVLGEKESVLLHCFNELDSVQKTALINDTVYILGTDSDNIGKNESFDDFYINMGEKILAYNISDGTVSSVMETGTVEMSETLNGTLMIYAHDNNGYFFTEYNPNGDFSDKQYSEIGQMHSFTVCGSEKYIYSGSDTNASLASFKETGKADIPIEDLLNFNVKYCSDGRIGYVAYNSSEQENTYSNMLKEIDISEFLSVDLSKNITMISAEYIADTPSSLGYSIVQEQVDYDSFALTVLSQDPKNDIYLLYTRSGFADNIKSKGAFYPLNEIEGVSEYIDSCFPGLKAAATNENGEIWMLPIAFNVPVLAYSEEKCGDISALTADELISLINDYSKNEKADSLGEFNAYFISEMMMSNYLFGNADLDTEEFRTLAKTLKENVFKSDAFGNKISDSMQKAMSTGDYSDVSLTLAHGGIYENEFLSNSGAIVSEFPMMTNNSVPATCALICVNPMSRNLEQTLNYISVLAKSLSVDDESLMRENSPKFAQSKYFEELKEVYKNADVRFSYSGEIVMNDFYAYLEGKIELDEFINEANRKLSAYLNE